MGVYINMYIKMHIYTYIHIYVNVYIRLHTYVCMQKYISTHIYANKIVPGSRMSSLKIGSMNSSGASSVSAAIYMPSVIHNPVQNISAEHIAGNVDTRITAIGI